MEKQFFLQDMVGGGGGGWGGEGGCLAPTCPPFSTALVYEHLYVTLQIGKKPRILYLVYLFLKYNFEIVYT